MDCPELFSLMLDPPISSSSPPEFKKFKIFDGKGLGIGWGKLNSNGWEVVHQPLGFGQTLICDHFGDLKAVAEWLLEEFPAASIHPVYRVIELRRLPPYSCRDFRDQAGYNWRFERFQTSLKCGVCGRKVGEFFACVDPRPDSPNLLACVRCVDIVYPIVPAAVDQITV